MNIQAFRRMATNTASTKRSGLTSGFATNLTNLKCLPLMPVDAEMRKRLDLNTPHVVYDTYLHGVTDIKRGDHLVINSVEYPIRSVAPWPWPPETFIHLVVEDLSN
jgi:hypothetical protein